MLIQAEIINASWLNNNILSYLCRHEKIDNMGNSGGDGPLVPGLALHATVVHRGDGEDEEGAVRRVRQPKPVPSIAQP